MCSDFWADGRAMVTMDASSTTISWATAMTARAAGMTKGVRSGEMTSRPSMAERMEMAGVMTPSPKNRPAPMMPKMPIMLRDFALRATRVARAMRERVPPSPLLSARMMKVTYLRVTTTVSDQKISERMP